MRIILIGAAASAIDAVIFVPASISSVKLHLMLCAGAVVFKVLEDLPSANALIGLSQQAGFLVGPGLGAALVAFAGTAGAFAFDSLTFIVSTINGKTPLSGGRAQGSLTKTNATLLGFGFGFARIKQRFGRRTTSSLRNEQGRWSDFITQQFKNAPLVIR